MLILSHPTGNANVREAARAFADSGMLAELWTSVSWDSTSAMNRLLPRSLAAQLERRSFAYPTRELIHTAPWLELGRMLASRWRWTSLVRQETGMFCVDAVYRGLDQKVAARLTGARGIDAVFAYEDGALATFNAARKLGMQRIYELPIGYWRAGRELMTEEAALQPEWAMTLPGNQDSDAKLARKDEELALASHVVVPSEFVRQTLSKGGRFDAKVSVVNYGAPAAPGSRSLRSTEGKLRVLFAGAMSQRKGISYLFAAAGQVEAEIELTLIGSRARECRILDAALQSHRWLGTLPHSEVLAEMQRHDVFVLPTLFEGFALVILEAMSRGLPVITTPNSGAEGIITDGEDGFIVPVRSAEAIAEKLELLAGDRDRLAAMSEAAQKKAAFHSWARYRRQLVSEVELVMGASPAQGPLAPSRAGSTGAGPC
jgi:glycosyltransferase involved in cell wall biosynthesis